MTVLITFIQKAIMQGVCMLFGADGEILTEKKSQLAITATFSGNFASLDFNQESLSTIVILKY